jgi:hypothetical protein
MGLQFHVAEPHHFYAAPTMTLSKNFDAAPATALLYIKTTFSNQTKVYIRVTDIFPSTFFMT